jgi:hypothetical protein
MEVAGDVAVKSLAAVNDDIIPFFTAAARDLIAVEKENAKDIAGTIITLLLVEYYGMFYGSIV